MPQVPEHYGYGFSVNVIPFPMGIAGLNCN